MQLSNKWMVDALEGLPSTSPILSCIKNATKIHSAVAGLDWVTGEFQFVKVDCSVL